MDWVSIIIALLGALAGGGLTALLTVRETRKSKKLENKEKELDLADKQKDEVISDWKELAEMYRTRVDELRDTLAVRTEKLEEKEKTISELRTILGDRNSENTALTLMRCEKLQCPDRIPPFGFSKINIRDGRLVESSEE